MNKVPPGDGLVTGRLGKNLDRNLGAVEAAGALLERDHLRGGLQLLLFHLGIRDFSYYFKGYSGYQDIKNVVIYEHI
jgi:hypothetical protein